MTRQEEDQVHQSFLRQLEHDPALQEEIRASIKEVASGEIVTVQELRLILESDQSN